MKVIKRDGTTVDFDRSKIIRAIQKANEAVDPEERISEEQISAIAHFVQERNRQEPRKNCQEKKQQSKGTKESNHT